jgi:hypothetical protein
VKVEVV